MREKGIRRGFYADRGIMSIRIFERGSKLADLGNPSHSQSPPDLHKPLLFKNLKRRNIESAAAFLYLYFNDFGVR